MTLTSLTLQNFRGYTKKMFTFSKESTLIVGANAAGKTNVLESIVLLSTGKSFRANQNAEMIQWEKLFSRVSGDVDDAQLSCLVTPSLKTYTVNGVAKRHIDFIGQVKTVLFWPEDLEIVTDSPSVRRRYLDTVLLQVDREYRRNLLSYEKGLRQRNKLLDLIKEGKASRMQLLFWDQLLIKAGGIITDTRARFITFVNNTTFSNHHFSLFYDKSVISESRLEQYKDEEVAAKATLVGPHRDDFLVQYDNRNLEKFGSRGEQRIAVLWLKLAELAYIEQVVGTRPLLLLDDIFSELDEEHRHLVAELVERQQTILTSADIASVPIKIRKTARLIEV